jgi:hypothetical protein
MPIMRGLTGATKYLPANEFVLIDPVVVFPQQTKPVLRLPSQINTTMTPAAGK